MALCPLAIASKGNANDGTGEYYFALSGAGGGGAVVDQSFVATGTGTPPNGGSFTTRSEDTTGAGQAAFIMTDISGVTRWAIGTNGVEAGANTGDNFGIFAYADDGSFLTSAMIINRASGGVAMQNGLTVGNTLISTGPLISDSQLVGDNTDIGGGQIQINGTLGTGRVFDILYNRPVPGVEVLISSFDNVGAAVGAPVSYTAPVTGLYTLTMEATIFSAGLGFTNGTSVAVGYLQPALGTVTDSYLALDSVANPSAFTIPGQLNNSYVKDIVAVVTLTAGTSYTAGLSSFSMNLGTGGGIKFFIQPIIR